MPARVKSRLSKIKVSKTNLLLLTLNLLALSVIFYYRGGAFASQISRIVLDGISSAATIKSQDVLRDPGLSDEESAGCRYSSIDGLVYFCGYIKSSKDATPVEGVTIAVYEELPQNPSITDPTALYSGSGKYGGNLVNLFSSTWTNENGHYEITGRQGQNVYVAFLCGQDILGGLKRIESLSRIEYLDELVDCPSGSAYTTPPAQLNYVDRTGFLECTLDFLADVGSAVSSAFDPIHVGYSSKPSIEALNELSIDNFDFRFMPPSQAYALLGIGSPGTVGLGLVYPLATEAQLADDAEWLLGEEGLADGPWRKADCIETYEGVYEMCDEASTSNYLRQVEGLEGDDDLYLVMNHLRFIPPWSSKPAFARVDIRSSLRQINQSNSSVAKFVDAVFGNYVGVKQAVKQPDSATGITADVEYNKDSLLSCSVVRESLSINKTSTVGPGAALASPGELQRDVVEYGILSDRELAIPVCREDDGSLVTVQDCLDNPFLGVCRPEIYLPSGGGSAFMSFTSEERRDSVADPNGVRANIFDPVSTAASIDFGRDQRELVFPGEANIQAGRSPAAASFLSGSLTGKNYLDVLSSPASVKKVATDLEKEKGDEEKAAEGLEKSKQDNPLVTVETEKPSVNAIKQVVRIQDVGSDSVAHCTLSSIFQSEGNSMSSLTRGADFIGNIKQYVANYFTGNSEHATNTNAASGTFYTTDSQKRDAYLSQGARLTSNFWRDVFDGLRSTASGYTTTDFSQVSNISSWFEAVRGALARGVPTKSFANRQNFAVDGIHDAELRVNYSTLNESNFNSIFKLPSASSSLLANEWGSHANYPWNGVPAGNKCATAVDGPDGISRTCLVRTCGDVRAPISCTPAGCTIDSYTRTFINNSCTREERLECARNQESTEPSLSREQEERLRVQCALTGECDFEEDFRLCAMERAGPYTAAFPLSSTRTENKVTQEDQYSRMTGEGGTSVHVDNLSSSAENLARAFSSPAGQFIRQEAIGDADIAQSVSPDDGGLATQGFTIPVPGGVAPGIYTPAAPVTGNSGAGVDNMITYHCNNIGAPVIGNVIGGTWNCPVAPVPVCSGLFGNVSGIDKIPISPAGLGAIRTTFSLAEFQKSLPVYAALEEEYGIPCEVMAGIHYREAGNRPTGSFEDGGPLRNGDLLSDGRLVAQDLLADMGVSDGSAIDSIEKWAEAMMFHNGPGNSNCASPTLTNYKKCPAEFPGEDNNYIMAYADSNHDNMAIIYPADGMKADQFCRVMCQGGENARRYGKACGLCPVPIEEARVGALVLAKHLYNLWLGNLGAL